MDLLQTSEPTPDRFGYYRVGDLKLYSKLEAIELHTKTGIHPHWDFNEAVFSSYDWTKEPDTPILELYRRRAQQLRDKYDYIILCYSGGSDSQTVLESFIDNDIKLDEVVSYVNYAATGDEDNFLNSEAFRVSIPKMKEVVKDRPWMKHRVLDMTPLTMDYFNMVNTKFDWIYDMNMFYSPNCSSRESLGLKVKEWKDMIHAGKKVCILTGQDKPRVIHIDGKFIFRFLDVSFGGSVSVKSMRGEQPYADEFFFWTPDMPEIVIKQAHMIKNYLSSMDVTKLPFVGTKRSDLAFKEVNGVKYWLSNHGVHTIIYPKWDINTFSAGKTPSILFTPRDYWFFNIESENTVKKNWKLGIDKLWDTVPDYWKNDPSDMGAGLKASWSRDYYLE